MSVKIIKEDGVEIPYCESKFPAMEQYIVIEQMPISGSVAIELNSADSESIIKVMMIANAIRESSNCHITLLVPYLPYSRQDRVCNPGEAFSLKVFISMMAQVINSIVTIDVHNDEVFHKLGRMFNIETINLNYSYKESQFIDCLNKTITNGFNPDSIDVIIVPDLGACERADNVAKEFGKELIYFTKTRTENGVEQSVDERFRSTIKDNNTFMVVDDICDGGATFLPIARIVKEINPNAKMILCVTHGIFSKGVKSLIGYDEVYCLDTTYNRNRNI